jgi:hypothetical protein
MVGGFVDKLYVGSINKLASKQEIEEVWTRVVGHSSIFQPYIDKINFICPTATVFFLYATVGKWQLQMYKHYIEKQCMQMNDIGLKCFRR